MYEIEKGIEIPKVVRDAKPCKYPWNTMEITDSFFVEKEARKMSSLVSNAGKRWGKKFAVRTVDGGARVWRVE